MNKIFSIMVNDDDNELIKAVDILRDYGIDVVFITRSHIVDEFGKITKEIKVIQNMINASYGRVALHLPKGISYEDYVKNFLYVLSRNFSKDFSIISINSL